MRRLISGMIAAVAVMTAAPAMACDYGPCGEPYVAPIVSYNYAGCCGGWVNQRLADPEQQYYFVNQGPTYSGPGSYAPYPVYREGVVSGAPYYGYGHRGYSYGYGNRYYGGAAVIGPRYGYRTYRPYHPRVGYYHVPRVGYRHGYAPRHAYAPRYAPAPYHYGPRPLRRYY